MSTTYWGIITQTITSTNDPRLSVGQVLIGTYSYQSDGTDGTFCQNNSQGNNQTLQATICCYYPNAANFNRSFANCSSGGFLVVMNGAVSTFFCGDQSGYFSTSFSLSSFSFKSNLANDLGQEAQFLTSGTVTLSCPTAIQCATAVPCAPASATIKVNCP